VATRRIEAALALHPPTPFAAQVVLLVAVVAVAAVIVYGFGGRPAWAEWLAVIDAAATLPVVVRISWVALRP
jgi:uncharacterized membrane protein (DUF2068 family)